MVNETYLTDKIPSETINVQGGVSNVTGGQLDSSVTLVGPASDEMIVGTDYQVNQATQVRSAGEAGNLFGDESELVTQTSLAIRNGANEVYCVALDLTETTESFSATDSGSLSNSGVMDPLVTSYEITAEESGTTEDVSIDYESPPSAPSSGVAVNPATLEWTAASSGDWEITYEYGDFEAAADEAVVQSSRSTIILTEEETLIQYASDKAQSRAENNLDFTHVYGGRLPEADSSTYSTSLDARRAILAEPRGYQNSGEQDEARTVGAYGGYVASRALGLSTTADSINGFASLREDTGFSEADDFISARTTPLIDYPPIEIVKDMTTVDDTRFERVYVSEIVDEVIAGAQNIASDYVGGQNTETERRNLRRELRNLLIDLREETPRVLEDFVLAVQQDPNDNNKVNVQIGIQAVGVMDTIDITITVGNVVQAGVDN